MPDTVSLSPFDAYAGDDPYVFVSYSHVDSQQVFPDIARLNSEGCHIWFDEGIDPGNEWPDEIADALTNSTVFLVFISPRSATSKNVKMRLTSLSTTTSLSSPFILKKQNCHLVLRFAWAISRRSSATE